MNSISERQEKKRVGWTSDIHINFCIDAAKRQGFYNSILAVNLDALIIAGDISVGKCLAKDLQAFVNSIQIPTYVVLGNHDRWWPGSRPVRQELADVLVNNPSLHWLEQDGVVELHKGTALVGCDTWVDNPQDPSSDRHPKDWIYIEDVFPGKTTQERLALSKQLATEAAARLRARLSEAAQTNHVVIAATHIPPIFDITTSPPMSDYQISPWLGSAACGAVICSVAADHPKTHFIILAGHLHARVRQQVTHNVEVRIAAATYYEPQLEEVLIVSREGDPPSAERPPADAGEPGKASRDL